MAYMVQESLVFQVYVVQKYKNSYIKNVFILIISLKKKANSKFPITVLNITFMNKIIKSNEVNKS